MLTYYVDYGKRTVVAVLTIEETGKTFKGKAKCNQTDSFDQNVGETLAKMRALRKWMKAEASEATNNLKIADALRTRAEEYAKQKISRLARTQKWLDSYVSKL